MKRREFLTKVAMAVPAAATVVSPRQGWKKVFIQRPDGPLNTAVKTHLVTNPDGTFYAVGIDATGKVCGVTMSNPGCGWPNNGKYI